MIGEGSGILMIEEMEHALKRGAKIYCELAGYGAASDAYNVVATHPEGLGAVLAMEGGMADAGVSPDEVNYINAHATSTSIGDISECKAIEKVFGGHNLGKISISATKSSTGHMLGAAGAIEAIACIKSIETGLVHPTINLNEVDPELNPDFDFTPLKARQREVNVVLNNCLLYTSGKVIHVYRWFPPVLTGQFVHASKQTR